jgi:uncharacterized membrane protein YqjE
MSTSVRPDAEHRRDSIGDLLRELATESTALVRGEIELAKQEVRENAARLSRGLLFVALAALVGWTSLSTLVAAAVIALVPALGGALAGLAVALALAAVAGLLLLAGRRRLKSAHLKPEQTVESLRENKRWLKGTT